MNSTIGPSFKVFFFLNKVFVGPVNSVRDPLEKQKKCSFLPARDPQYMFSKKKKKRKRQNIDAGRSSCIKTGT